MIPSPTKLAFLTGVVLLAGEALGFPTRYDQRQDGDLNFRADVEDVVLIAVPPKDYFNNGMTWIGANFIRSGDIRNRNKPGRFPSRHASKHGFVPTEKSPYKVDLGKSSIPLVKVETPAVVEELKLIKIGDGVQEDSTVMTFVDSTTGSEGKTVKKELKTEEVTSPETTQETVVKSEMVTENMKEQMMSEQETINKPQEMESVPMKESEMEKKPEMMTDMKKHEVVNVKEDHMVVSKSDLDEKKHEPEVKKPVVEVKKQEPGDVEKSDVGMKRHEVEGNVNVMKHEVGLKSDVKKQEMDMKSDVKKQELDMKSDVKKHEMDTKSDVKKHEVGMKSDVKKQEMDMKSDVKKHEIDMKSEVKKPEVDMKRQEMDMNKHEVAVKAGGEEKKHEEEVKPVKVVQKRAEGHVTAGKQARSEEEDKTVPKKGSSLVPIGPDADPTSNTAREGCGPGAYRDESGKCVYE